jgi:small subunit ribosomal protein S1
MVMNPNFRNEEIEVTPAMIGWAEIKESHRQKTVLYAQAIGIENIPVGDSVQECLKLNYEGNYGYLPRNRIDNYEFKGIHHFIGVVFEFVVEHVDLESHIFVANRIQALDILKKKFWKTAKVGDNYRAFVRGLGPFNMYLVLDGVSVNMHRDEYSYSYVEDLREEVEIGDTLDVKITRLVKPGQKYMKKLLDGGEVEAIAGEDGYVEVSHRILLPDPWKNITNYQEKASYLGTITKVHHDHGIFIDLEPGLTVRTNFPPNSNGITLRKGEQVCIKLIEIDPKKRQMRAIVFSTRQSPEKLTRPATRRGRR